MKLLHCDGRKLRLWAISDEPLRTLTAAAAPFKVNGFHILDDDAARGLLHQLAAEQRGEATTIEPEQPRRAPAVQGRLPALKRHGQRWQGARSSRPLPDDPLDDLWRERES